MKPGTYIYAMSKLYFPKVKDYEVSENLIFITWADHFQCFDYMTGESQFKIDHGFESLKIIDNKLFGQKKEGSDILVYDLKGNLIQTINGRFYLWLVLQDGQFIFLPGKDKKNEGLGFRIDLATLTIADKLENYKNPLLVKGSVGYKWLVNTVYLYNIFTGDTLWTYDLGEGNYPSPGYSYLNNEHLIITIGDGRLISLNTESGKCVWQKKTNLYYYGMHPVNKNLYGFGHPFLFEVLDSKTGDLILSKQFPEMKEQFKRGIMGNINRVMEEGLYFTNLEKFGKLNFPHHEIEFVADLDIPKEPGLRSPSFPYNNCYFALDYNMNLQVIRPLLK